MSLDSRFRKHIPSDEDLNRNPTVTVETCGPIPRPKMSNDSAKWYAWGVGLLVMFGVAIECGMWFTSALMLVGSGVLFYVGDHTSGRRTISRIFEIVDEKYESRKLKKMDEKEKEVNNADQLLNKLKEEIGKKVEKEAQEKTWAKVREELKKKLDEEEKKQSSPNP
jgi:hypothetical protein